MWKYVCKRCGKSIVALMLCSFVCFILIRQLPGSIAYSIYGANAQRLTEQEIERIENALVSEQSIFQQYVDWASNLLRGNWGFSFSQQQEVYPMLAQQSMFTFMIVALSLVLSNFITIISFVFLQRTKLKTVRFVIEKTYLLFMIVPGFWICFFLLWLLGVEFQIFPLYGLGNDSFLSTLYRIALPSLALVLPSVFYGIKLLENDWASIQQLPFLKHLSQRRISTFRYAKHVLPHFCLVLLQLNGYLVVGFLGGVIAVETVFSIPGIGQLTVEATKMHDYPTLLMIILCSLAVVLIVQLIIDLLSSWLDPRVYRSLKE